MIDDFKRIFFKKLWLVNFGAAFAALIAIKFIRVGVSAFSSDTVGSQPLSEYLKFLFMIFGGDILGAALFAAIVAILCLPFALKGMKKTSTTISIILQALHGTFAIFSFVCILEMGGPLNKQAIDLTLMGTGSGAALWGGEVAKTIAGYMTIGNTLMILTTIALTTAAVLWEKHLYGWFKGRRAAVVAVVLGLEMIFTVAILPFLHSGEINKIRIYTNGLEKSALVDFVWSYLRSDRVDPNLIEDPFNFSFDGLDKVEADKVAPLARAIPQKTNVLMISFESIGAVYMERDPTEMPFFRSLQKMPGTQTLAEHYSAWSLTTKALFSIFCSELPYPEYTPEPLINPGIPCKSLFEVLHDNGYFTTFITSQDLAYDRQIRFYKHRKLDLIWDLKNMPGAENVWHSTWGIDDKYAIDKMLDVLEKKRDKPFFAFYIMTMGHHPFLSSKEHADNPLGDRVPNHMREIRAADELLKGIFERLKKSGQIDNTLVVVFSDHGTGHGRYLGRSAWQPVIKVPALMHGPQLKGEAGSTNLVTSHLDIAPTVLGLLGIPVPCTMKGRNLRTEADHRIALFGGRPPKWHLGLADENWKFIWEDKSIEMLFDLSIDPGELNNVAGEHPDRVKYYKKKINEWGAFSTNLIENYAPVLKASKCSL